MCVCVLLFLHQRLELLQVYGGNSDMVFSLCASDGIVSVAIELEINIPMFIDLCITVQS